MSETTTTTQYEDIELKCCEKDCGQKFIWTAGEQEWFAQKGFSAPRRCKACRDRKRAEKEQQGGGNRR